MTHTTAPPGEQITTAETVRFVTDLAGLCFREASAPEAEGFSRRIETTIEVCRDGCWQHPAYGEVRVTPELRESFVRNFCADVRKVGELPIDYDHHEGPAAAWIYALRNEGPTLLADVWVTPAGAEKIRSGEYRKFSPEWHPDWRDPETGAQYGPTLFGGGFTNKPFFRDLAALQCSEGGPTSQVQGPRRSEAEPDASFEEAGGAPAPPETLDFGPETVQMRERITAVEAENAALRAEVERRDVEGALAGLRFHEGRAMLAPASRRGLADAVLALPRETRERVLGAVRELRLVELGERGFTATETDAETLTPAEESAVRAMSERNGLRVEEVRRQFLEVRRSRGVGR